MKAKLVGAILIAGLFASSAFAVYDWQALYQNNLMSSVTNYGRLGQVKGGGDPYTFWPAPAIDIDGNLIPPLMNYVYGWGLWVGAQVRNDSIPGKMDSLVTMGYCTYTSNGYEYTPGAVVDGVPQSSADADVKVYMSTESDWSLKKTNGEDSIVSMLDTRCVYNDYNASNHLTGRPLKIEVTQTTYQWNAPAVTDAIYFVFEVKNTSEDTLFDVYLSPTTDCDIGNESGTSANDVCYWDSTTNMGYQYNATSTETGWTRPPGCIGFVFLRSPVATKEFTAPDGYHISVGDTIGLYAFKVFNINIDPQTDIGQYLEMAGYNYQTGEFLRLDPKPSPGDQRIMESTGPIDLLPGETARVIVCMICANFDYAYMGVNDTLAIAELRQKARDAKTVFENCIVQNQTQIALTAPVESAVLSGTQAITWTYGGNAASTDTVDLYYSRDGYAWDSLAYDQPNTGSYTWNTVLNPDGTRYKVSAILHGPSKLASSVSKTFIINNAGNATPEAAMTRPDTVITGVYNWRWLVGDADGDELFASHYVMQEGTDTWQKVAGPISSSPQNTQIWQEYSYDWNTDSMVDANYKLKTVIYDGQETVVDSSTTYYGLYNPRVHHPGSNTGYSNMPVKWYTYKSDLITGHTYEARFKPIERGTYNATYLCYPAVYKYDLWDVTSDSLISSDWIVQESNCPDYYYKDPIGQIYSGFVIQSGDAVFNPGAATFDSVLRPPTDPSVDTLWWKTIISPDMRWAKLNSNYEIRWHQLAGGGDTLLTNDTISCEVWDMLYNVQIPADTVLLSNVSTFSWNFGGTKTLAGRTIITATANNTRRWMNLCGMLLYFNNPAHATLGNYMTWATHPQEGDVWHIYSSGSIPPREGDVYTFTPTGVEGTPGEAIGTSLLLRPNAPNPFGQTTTITYQLPNNGKASLRVYNIAGQLVRTLVNSNQSAGPHSVKWDGRDNAQNKVSAGVYIYRLQADGRELTQKMVVIR